MTPLGDEIVGQACRQQMRGHDGGSAPCSRCGRRERVRHRPGGRTTLRQRNGRRVGDRVGQPRIDRWHDRSDIEAVLRRTLQRRRRTNAADGLEQRHAQREDVARRAERLAAGLLGRHVEAGAHDHASRRHRLADLVETPSDPEIGELRVTAVVEQHVGRLDVAMDDAGRVGRIECRRHLGPDPGDVGRRQSSITGEPFGERSSGDEFHHDVEHPVVGTGVEHRHRVRVDESCGCP